jgi:hypothetical protein
MDIAANLDESNMNQEFVSLVKSLKVPLLNPKEIAALEQLEQEWRHWAEREKQIMPLRIEAEQKAAYAAFVDDPSEANERRLAALADPLLTGKQYGLLRRAFGELRCRITARAAAILKPTLGRIRETLAAEHKRRREQAEEVMGSKDRHPSVKQARAALDCIEYIHGSVFRSCAGHIDASPFTLAGGLVGK